MKLAEYDISHPFTATVMKSERITNSNTAEVRHIDLSVRNESFHFIEGQSVAVLAPGSEAFGNERHVRLYSIASSREGEGSKPDEISLCVRRCFYIDPVSGERYPGLASNYLCDLKPGDTIEMAGPYGRHFMPPRDSSHNLLMIGIGTGIAPFRAFMKHIYEDRKEWTGKVRLFYGARTGMDLLYQNEQNQDLANYYDQDTFKAFEAVSPRPHFDEPVDFDRTFVDNVEEAWSMIKDPNTHVYISGISTLEEALDRAFAKAASSAEAWETLKAKIIEDGRWSTLLYD